VTEVCPVCTGSQCRVYMDGSTTSLRSDMIGSSRKTTAPGRILRCTQCGFGFSELRSSEGQIAEAYRDMDSSVYEAESKRRAKTAAGHLKIVSRYAKPPGDILDVGCASGLFLKAAADAGWKVTGVEPSEALTRKARALLARAGEVHATTLEMCPFPPQSFDAITLFDVLEHVPDSPGFLATCAALLKPGGWIFLNVPDLDSWEARILGLRWPLLLPEHLNYFNRNSLRLCGERAGLVLQHFGRRPAWFSIEYVSYRLSQHRIPGARLVYRLAQSTALGDLSIPVFLGETYAVWRRPSVPGA
jgi:SAM-dependent methyltransferase